MGWGQILRFCSNDSRCFLVVIKELSRGHKDDLSQDVTDNARGQANGVESRWSLRQGFCSK